MRAACCDERSFQRYDLCSQQLLKRKIGMEARAPPLCALTGRTDGCTLPVADQYAKEDHSRLLVLCGTFCYSCTSEQAGSHAMTVSQSDGR
jgi:hypothetical protein